MKNKLSITLVHSLVIIAAFLVIQIIIISIATMFDNAFSVAPYSESKLFSVISVGITQLVLLVLVIILRKIYSIRIYDYLDIHVIDYKLLILIALLALSFQALGTELENLAAEIFGRGNGYYALINTVAMLPGLKGALLALVLIVIAPSVGEELFFRRILQHGLMERYSRTFGIIITSVLFTAVHFNVNYIAPIFILSLILGYLYSRFGNLVYCIGFHFLTNLVVLVLIRNKAFGLKGFLSFATVEHIDFRIIIGAAVVFLCAGYAVLFGKFSLAKNTKPGMTD